jgi:hypothetical protein
MPSKSFFPERNRPNVLVGPNHQWQESVAILSIPHKKRSENAISQ